jgi:hypothetical protein
MNVERQLGLVPHYVANLLMVLLVVGVLRAVAGDVGIVVELVVVVAVVLVYPTLVRWLGVEPSAWKDSEET